MSVAAAEGTPELSLVDSQRVVAILENALQKLGILACITTGARNEQQSQVVGDEITHIIVEQRSLEERYEDLLEDRLRLKAQSNPNKVKIAENAEEITQVASSLRQSTKLLCRNLQDNPNLAENMEKIQKERSGVEELLHKTVQELLSRVYNSLQQKVENEKQKKDVYQQLVAREKEVISTVENLKRELATEKKDYDTNLSQLNSQVSKLKEEVQDMRTKTAIERKYLAKERKAREDTVLRMNEKTENDLQEELKRLDKIEYIENLSHEQTMNFLRAKQTKLNASLEHWTEKSANDILELDTQLKSLTEERNEAVNNLHLREANYKADVAEKEARAAEERRQAQMKAMQEAERARRLNAVLNLQVLYRMHLGVRERKRRDDEKNGKGKKKKGGKGKGKKK